MAKYIRHAKRECFPLFDTRLSEYQESAALEPETSNPMIWKRFVAFYKYVSNSEVFEACLCYPSVHGTTL